MTKVYATSLSGNDCIDSRATLVTLAGMSLISDIWLQLGGNASVMYTTTICAAVSRGAYAWLQSRDSLV